MTTARTPIQETGQRAARLLAAIVLVCAPATTLAQNVTVFAAASLKNALDEVGRAYSAGGSAKFVGSYASTSALAKQIERGAPADVYVAADIRWMDYLQQRGSIDAGTRISLLRNRLVLIAPAPAAVPVRIVRGFPLAQLLGDGRLAMGDPDHVPAGIYGRAALESLAVWQAVAPKIARADSVRAALALVARGEAPLGIVYSTDALAEETVKVVAELPAGSHPDIVYPAAVVARAPNRAAAGRLLAFLRTREAGAIFERHGFTLYRK